MLPPMAAVAAWALLGERLGVKGAIGCLVAFLGVVFIARPEGLLGNISAAGAPLAHDWRLTEGDWLGKGTDGEPDHAGWTYGVAMGVASAALSTGDLAQ